MPHEPYSADRILAMRQEIQDQDSGLPLFSDELVRVVRNLWWEFDPIGVRVLRDACDDEYDTYVWWTLTTLRDGGDLDLVVYKALDSMGQASKIAPDLVSGFVNKLNSCGS